ncbi:two-component system sensor histidine kinase UhpB [Bradyrhizobium sp. LM2.9]
MWQNLSLRGRINLLLALLLALGLAVNIGRQVAEAGPRVQAEDQSVIRLAREFIGMIVADLNEAPDPDTRLNQIARDLSRLRHVSIALRDAGGKPLTQPRADADDDTRGPPAWFVGLVHPEQTAVSVPVSIHGKPGSLLITSHPDDEIAEIWDAIVTQLEVGSGIALALFLVMMNVVGRALAPLQSLADVMAELEDGRYQARVTPGGAPELAAICTKLNHLAATLSEAVEDKRRLAERAVSLQDVERKEIARELHDEFGPYLFSLRAHASALAKQADGRAPSAEAVRKHGSAMMEQINALQQFNRRVLERLRPVGLAELGLRQALGIAVAAVAGVASRCRHRDRDLSGAWRHGGDRRPHDLPHRAGGAHQRVPPRRRDLGQCPHRAGGAGGGRWSRLRPGAGQRQWPRHGAGP